MKFAFLEVLVEGAVVRWSEVAPTRAINQTVPCYHALLCIWDLDNHLKLTWFSRLALKLTPSEDLGAGCHGGGRPQLENT